MKLNTLFISVVVLGSLGIFISDIPHYYIYFLLGIGYLFTFYISKREEDSTRSQFWSAIIFGPFFILLGTLYVFF